MKHKIYLIIIIITLIVSVGITAYAVDIYTEAYQIVESSTYNWQWNTGTDYHNLIRLDEYGDRYIGGFGYDISNAVKKCVDKWNLENSTSYTSADFYIYKQVQFSTYNLSGTGVILYSKSNYIFISRDIPTITSSVTGQTDTNLVHVNGVLGGWSAANETTSFHYIGSGTLDYPSYIQELSSPYTYEFNLSGDRYIQNGNTDDILNLNYVNYGTGHRLRVEDSEETTIYQGSTSDDTEQTYNLTDFGIIFSDEYTFILEEFTVKIINNELTTYYLEVDSFTENLTVAPYWDFNIIGDDVIQSIDEGAVTVTMDDNEDFTIIVRNSDDDINQTMTFNDTQILSRSLNEIAIVSGINKFELWSGIKVTPYWVEPYTDQKLLETITKDYSFANSFIGTIYTINFTDGNTYNLPDNLMIVNGTEENKYLYINDEFINIIYPDDNNEFTTILKDNCNWQIGNNNIVFYDDAELTSISNSLVITLLRLVNDNPNDPINSGGDTGGIVYNDEYGLWEFPQLSENAEILDYIKYPFQFVGALFKNIVSFVNNLISGVGEVNGLMGTLFSFIPQEFIGLLFGVITISILIGIIKLFLRR